MVRPKCRLMFGSPFRLVAPVLAVLVGLVAGCSADQGQALDVAVAATVEALQAEVPTAIPPTASPAEPTVIPATTVPPPPTATAAPSATATPEPIIFPPCTYLGPDDFGNMQVDLVFTNEFATPTGITVTVSIGDQVARITIDTALPGEMMHIDADTLEDEPASWRSYDDITCEILEIAESSPGTAPDLPDPDNNSCNFAEVDAFGDIQVELDIQNPFAETEENVDLLIEYAIYADSVRFGDSRQGVEFYGAEERRWLQDDSLTSLPSWAATGAAITCQILSMERS
jgi:hypothetical protein